MPAPRRIPIFDFDGTLVDSDAALVAPFWALGVDPTAIPLGLPVVEACTRAGIAVADYLDHYDLEAVQSFPGVDELVTGLDRWGLCSNKDRASGLAELDRLGWSPTVALFSDDFDCRPKALGPVLGALAIEPADAVFVGDTGHDRATAAAAGVTFALAAWNPRAAATALADDLLLRRPSEVLGLLG